MLPENIVLLVELVKKISKADEVIVFGSYARGEAQINSDLDIAIIKENIMNRHEESFNIQNAVYKQFLIPLDIVLMDRIAYTDRASSPGTIQYEIATKGIRV